MPRYTFVVKTGDEEALALYNKLLSEGVDVRRFHRNSHPIPGFDGFAERKAKTEARNQEIIAKYTADPKANSTPRLGAEYGLSRERICQILRSVNAIGTAQGRYDVAKESLAETKATIKQETKVLWENKLAEAQELVRGGQSTRSAAASVGFDKHGNFTNILNKRCRLAGIPINSGRHKDFT